MKFKKKLSYLIVGYGTIGKIHLKILSKFTYIDKIFVVEKDITKHPQKKINKAHFFKDLKKLNLKKMKIKLASICTETETHFDIAKYLLNNSINILVEKPLAQNSYIAKKISNYAIKKDKTLFTGHVERFNPVIIKLKKLFEKNYFGQIYSISFQRIGPEPPKLKNRDIVLDLSIHDVDLINFLTGSTNLFKKIIKIKNKLDVYDSAHLILKRRKLFIYIESNWISPTKFRTIRIIGEKKSADADLIQQKLNVNYKTEYKNKLGVSKINSKSIKIQKKEPLKEQLKFFIYSSLNNKKLSNQFAIKSLKSIGL